MGGMSKSEELPSPPKDLEPALIKYGSKGEAVKLMKKKLVAFGYSLNPNNENFLLDTEKALKAFQGREGLPTTGILDKDTIAKLDAGPDPENPHFKKRGAFWMKTFDKYMGKKETDKELQAVLVPGWKKYFGLGIKTLVGIGAAWCGLMAGQIYFENGFEVPKRGAAAKTYGTAVAGVYIDFKKNGLPRGATVHLDHDCDCKGDSNHVAFPVGDCAPEDLVKKGATVTMRGGNQSNMVKDSEFKACEICAAHWMDPDPNNPPPKITKSVNCSKSAPTGESTR